jgi:hypothetical protein
MDAAFPQGPISGSALCVAGARHATARAAPQAATGIRARRPIGAGQRPVILTRPARQHARRLIAAVATAPRKSAMKRTTLLTTSFFALFMLSVAAVGIGAAVDASPPTLMSRVDYTVARNAIESSARAAMARCRGTRGVERDVCKAEVRAQERVSKADLAARYRGTVAAADEARQARLKAGFEVAKARCGARTGDARLDCLRAARGERSRSLAQARPAST